MMAIWSKPKPGAGRPAGLPDGYTLKQYIPLRDAGLIKAKKVMEFMAANDKFIADNEIAHKAISKVVEILEIPGAYNTKLQAAKTLLEYTQRKPVAVTETTVKSVESWLDDIANDPETAVYPPPVV